MGRATTPSVERLIDHAFAGMPGGPLADELSTWLAGSKRFRAFAEAHRDKIRKKLRGATDADSRLDVRAELRVACLLLAERQMEVAWEAYGSTVGGPDFSVAYRGERSLNLEVTRQHGASAPGLGGPLLAKLRQLPSGAPNALLVAVEGDRADAFDVASVVRGLRARADAKDEGFFSSRGLRGTRGFYERFLRLGSVLVWCEGAVGDARATAWSNGSARIAVPERTVRACLAGLRAG